MPAEVAGLLGEVERVVVLHPAVPPLAPPLPKLPLKIRLQLLEEILETTMQQLEEILRLPSLLIPK
jgi:hypothetical protein